MEISDPRIDVALVPSGSVARVVNGPEKEYRDLPCVITPTGRCITRWTPTDEERLRLAAGEDVFVTLLTTGPINPFYVTVGPVDWRADV